MQHKNPVAAAGRARGQRHQAAIQPGGQCRHECQQCVGQLTNVLLPRDRGPRTTDPPWPGGLKTTPDGRSRSYVRCAIAVAQGFREGGMLLTEAGA